MTSFEMKNQLHGTTMYAFHPALRRTGIVGWVGERERERKPKREKLPPWESKGGDSTLYSHNMRREEGGTGFNNVLAWHHSGSLFLVGKVN